jgi:hypothetical protein
MSDAAVYASDAHPAPDSDFAPGELRHLVEGNRGRLLDPRRTPVTVREVAPERGSFVIRVDAFEDAGANWELGLEEIERFQFARTAKLASAAALAELQQSAARFDRDLSIDCDPDARERSAQRLEQCRDVARAWLGERTGGLSVDIGEQIGRRVGHPALYALLDDFLVELELDEIERDFAASLVTNPRAGETVKGHAIVAAELGLCRYRGKAPRDPDLFAGSWTRARRADHLLHRLAFTQELWLRLGRRELTLYRAAASDEALQPARPATFVSATFSRPVADEHFEGGPSTRVAALWRQRVPLERTLMTFLETKAMNARYHEAEAVLVADPSNAAF